MVIFGRRRRFTRITRDNYLRLFNAPGKQPDIIKDLIASLADLGLDVLFAEFLNRRRSKCGVSCGKSDTFAKIEYANVSKQVPVLTLFLKSHAQYCSLGIGKDNNWRSSYEHTDEIRRRWKSLLDKHSYTDHKGKLYDKDMLVFFRSAPDLVTYMLVYQLGDTVDWMVKTADGIVQPKGVYRSSMPGYHIVYRNEQDYERAEEVGQFAVITALICDTLTERAPEGYGEPVREIIKIQFHHPAQKNFRWDGYTRQD